MAYPYRRSHYRYQRLRLWLWSRPAALAGALGIAGATGLGYVFGQDQSAARQAPISPWQASIPRAAPAIHNLPREQQLSRAFEIAFGGSDEVIRHVGASGEPTRFRAGALVQAPFGHVLLSEGQVLAPKAASKGKLAAVYLTSSSGGLREQSRFVPAIESGSMGQLGEWRVRSDFGHYPVVEVRAAGTRGELTCSWIILLELRPEGPVELATIPAAFDNSEASLDGRLTRLEGRIRGIEPDRGFEVAYSGSTEFTERFIRRGATYVLASGQSRMKNC